MFCDKTESYSNFNGSLWLSLALSLALSLSWFVHKALARLTASLLRCNNLIIMVWTSFTNVFVIICDNLISPGPSPTWSFWSLSLEFIISFSDQLSNKFLMWSVSLSLSFLISWFCYQCTQILDFQYDQHFLFDPKTIVFFRKLGLCLSALSGIKLWLTIL